MPTGYTHAVQTGEVADFETFALQCARAMGALIMMRDELMGAPIPERFEPSTYHRRELEKAEARLLELRSMTPDEVRAAWREKREEAGRRRQEYRERKQVEESRYRAMLAEVEAWEPPTDEHAGLKSFMAEQLRESIRFDCGDWLPDADLPAADEWFRAEVEKAEQDIERHRSEDRKERERTEARNRWIQQLRDSLARTDA